MEADGYKERMSQLAESFPSLKGQPGVRPFDNELLEAQLREAWMTAGSSLAIAFVLSVWDPRRFKVDADEVREACGAKRVYRPFGEDAAPLNFRLGQQGEEGTLERPTRSFYLAPYCFNVSEAFQRWDGKHVAAFLAWARAPWWP